MLFRRRTRESLLQRFRVHMWPRRSLGRSAQYFWKRILRLRATPHAIAAGVAAGAFAAFLPFLGLHILIAAGLAWVIRGNMLAAALGTAAIGNPLSFPLIWAATYAGGRFLLHVGPASSAPLHIGRQLRHMDFAALWHPVLEPMTVGGIPLGIAAGVILYFPIRAAVSAFRNARRARKLRHARYAPDMAASQGPQVSES
jgi:uncharacterized protein (DUF2062 family)